jgi:type I protein arginine methyltransferase
MTEIDRALSSGGSELGQHIPIHYHYQMLVDTERMNAFAAAIRKRVQPGMRVADLGCGTGVLSFFAAQCGARVWAVEAIPELAAMTKKFIQTNKVEEQVTVVNADASQWLPPEPVDIVLCEMLHSALLREKQVEVLQSFRRAHVAQFGRAPLFLPEATLLAVQPVTQDYWYEGYFAPLPLFQSAYADAADCMPRGEPVMYATVDYNESNNEPLIGQVRCTLHHAATINALRFVTRSVLAMDMSSGSTVDWYNQNLIIPLPEPLSIGDREHLDVSFSYRAGDPIAALTDSLRVTVVATQTVTE